MPNEKREEAREQPEFGEKNQIVCGFFAISA
jgi:hypothetical protein